MSDLNTTILVFQVKDHPGNSHSLSIPHNAEAEMFQLFEFLQCGCLNCCKILEKTSCDQVNDDGSADHRDFL